MTVNPPIVSGITAGVLIIMQLLLMSGVIRTRLSAKQSLGDGNHPVLLRAIRRHGNFAENAAIFAVALGLLEMLGEGRVLMALLCGGFVVGRLLHALGLSQATSVNGFRKFGTILSAIVGVVVGVRLILIGIAAL